jgi:trk system potassium uptake protein TrkH
MSFNSFREKANIFLYDSRDLVLSRLRVLSFLVSLVAVGTLVYDYGFHHGDDTSALLLDVVKGTFAFYILYYITRFVYHFHPKKFLRQTWFEGAMMLLLFVEGISYNLFDTLLLQSLFESLGIGGFADFSTIFIQMYLLILVGLKISRGTTLLPLLKLHPASLFMLSFLVIILSGTGLLLLPEMTYSGELSFLDALFTSTSATCVTGLMVENATMFTFKGQVIIMILIKLGGLNIIAFGTFIALMSKFGVGVKQHDVIEDFMHKDNALSAKGMLGRIILWSTVIELVGAMLLYVLWLDNIPFKTAGDKLFSSVFHSISAFNSAGISLFENGFYQEFVRDNYYVQMVIALLIFVGALGFNSLFNIFTFSHMRERLKFPWKQINFSTKIALYFSLVFVILGTVAFYFIEQGNTLKDQSFIESLITSVFQSVNRTSGFTSVHYADVGVPFLLLMIVLMFIGASSSSTGGGIKTSTFAILWASTLSTIRGRKRVELFKRTINQVLLKRAFTVLIFFLVGNMICIIALSITEGDILAMQGRGVFDLIFEQVSALGTVGLSTGITSELSSAGKTIVMISMFVGRVGTLTVAFAVSKRLISNKYEYPTGHTMVG